MLYRELRHREQHDAREESLKKSEGTAMKKTSAYVPGCCFGAVSPLRIDEIGGR